MPDAVALRLMTKEEAREAMDTVVAELESGLSAMERASAVVAELDAREGYRALGYRSLAACLADELKVTRQRAYAVLAEMRGRALLTEAVGAPIPVTVRDAQAIARHPEVAPKVAAAVKAGVEPTKAYLEALAAQRQMGPIPKPSKVHRGQQTVIDRLRGVAEALDEIADQLDDSPLDPQFGRMVERVVAAGERILRRE